MQKQILYVNIIFWTIATYTMKHPILHIAYNTNNNLHELEAKLTEKFSTQSKCPTIENALSHQSPEVIRVHSHDYLNNLDENTSITLAAINNSYHMAWYPNRYSKTYLPPLLDNVSTTFAATECVIAVNKLTDVRSNCAISLAESYSFAGHNCGNKGDVYAPIPMAAAYALEEHNDTVKRILVIDENITANTAEYYFKNGNGSIFFPENNPELSELFQDKIIMQHHITDGLWDFLHNNIIDLAFYNINIDDVEPIENLHPADAKERNLKIWSLLHQQVPTVFIFSGDKNSHQDTTFSTIEYIAQTASKIASSNATHNSLQEQIKTEFNELMTDMQNFTASLKKCSLPIPIPQSTYQFDGSNSTQSYSSYSSSSSCSDLEYKRHKLKKRLGLSCSSSNDYQAAETSSTHDDGNDTSSYGDENNEKF